jgi:UDP-glucose 4-epimerase
VIECDIRDKQEIEWVFSQHDFGVVIHLASLLSTASERDPQEATRVNVAGSLNLLDAVRRFDVPRFIYGSSISVYGSCPYPSEGGVSEHERPTPETVYGATKRAVEAIGGDHADRYGLEFIALRISTVLGSGAVHTASPWRSEIFENVAAEERVELTIPYGPSEALPLIHVSDVADMLALLVTAQRTSSSVYNTPSETWVLDELAAYINSLNENVRFSFGQSCVEGIPRTIDGRRFEKEFRYRPVLLGERLRQAAHNPSFMPPATGTATPVR